MKIFLKIFFVANETDIHFEPKITKLCIYMNHFADFFLFLSTQCIKRRMFFRTYESSNWGYNKVGFQKDKLLGFFSGTPCINSIIQFKIFCYLLATEFYRKYAFQDRSWFFCMFYSYWAIAVLVTHVGRKQSIFSWENNVLWFLSSNFKQLYLAYFLFKQKN